MVQSTLFPTNHILIQAITFVISSYLNSFRSVSDFIISRPNSLPFEPCFYLFKYEGAMYCVIRGSAEPGDFATLSHMPESFSKFGCFHAGVFRAAKFVYSQIYRHISGFTGDVYIIGHSYGAACASVLTAILRKKMPATFGRVKTIGFAPYPALDPKTAGKLKDSLFNVVLENDMIPSVTIHNLYGALNKTGSVDFDDEQSIADGVSSLFDTYDVVDVPSGDLIVGSLKNISGVYAKEITKLINYNHKFIRYLGGTVYYLDSRCENGHLNDCLVKNPRKSFYHLFLNANGIRNHTPKPYQTFLKNLKDD